MNKLRAAGVTIVALLAATVFPSVTTAADEPVNTFDERAYKKDIQALTAWPHRLAGFGEYTAERRDAWDLLCQAVPPIDAKARSEQLDDQAEHLLELEDNPDFIKPGPGSLAASAYVQNRLKEIASSRALDASEYRVFTQEFDVVLPLTTECRIFVDGEEMQAEDPDETVIYALRPNGLMAPVTPAEGLEGESLYAGKGELEEYGRNSLKDKIVILDYNGDWRTPFAFGAKAVVIIGSNTGSWPTKLHAYEPANLPRFYVTQQTAKRLNLTGESHRLRIQAACQWRRFRGRNVIAVLRGTNPRFGTTVGPRQAIVLAAPLDSLSEVPLISPGARDAANCASLLQLVEYFGVNRPRRDMIFAFLDGQSQCHMGARAFYSAIHRPLDKDYSGPEGLVNKTAGRSFDEWMENLQKELEFQAYAIQILSQPNIYEPDTATMKAERDDLVRQLGGNPLLKIGPVLVSTWYMVLTAATVLLAVVLTVAIGGQVDNEMESGVPALIVGQRLASVLGVVMVVALAYGLIDQAVLRGVRLRQEEAWRALQAEIDNLEQDITGLEQSHRATMNLLKELAREKNSDALDELRPMRIRMDGLLDELKDAQEEQQRLQVRSDEAADRVSNSSEGEKDIAIAELEAAEAELAEAKRATEQVQAMIDEALPRFIQLTVDDMLYNGALRIVHKKWDPAEHAEALSQVLINSNPQWQEMMRERFIDQLLGDPAEGRIGKFAQLKAMAIDNCKIRRAELIEDVAELKKARKLWDAMGPGKPDRDGNSLTLHLSMNLGDRRDRWTFIHGDESAPLADDLVGNYTDQVFKPAIAVSDELADIAPGFDKRALTGEQEGSLFGGFSVDSSGIARLFGVYNLSIRTVMDQLPRQGQPYDTTENLDAGLIFEQLLEVAPFLKALAENETLSPAGTFAPSAIYQEVAWDGDKNTGPKVNRISAGAAMRTHAVPQAAVAVYDNPHWTGGTDRAIPGYVEQLIYVTDSKGLYNVGPADGTNIRYVYPVRFAAIFDEPPVVDGDQVRPVDRNAVNSRQSRGIVRFVSNVETFGQMAVTLIKIRSMTFVNFGFSRVGGTVVMRDYSATNLAANEHLVCESGQTLTAFVPFECKGLKLFNSSALVVLNNERAPQLVEGIGIPIQSIEAEFTHPVTALYSAKDLGNLNDSRLDVLRDNGIKQESLERISGQARDTREDAILAGPEGEGLLKYIADLVVSSSLSRRVHGPLMGVMKDLVKAVVLLLLLAMPFAFAMERLIIGTPHIYRQIVWFVIFFMGTFFLLYIVNPAFRIAATPAVIFLAFAVILLSSTVIFILIRKLQTEVRRMQGLGATVHSTDVSRISTMGAAVMMGISTMRRRPLRTILTSITVVLLTFTILTFASFESSYGNRKTYKEPLASLPPRIMVRDPLWSPMDDAVHVSLRGYLGKKADVIERVWVSPTAQEAEASSKSGMSLDKLLTTSDTKRIVSVSAAIGIDIVDVQKQPDLARLFSPKARVDLLESNGVFLTSAVAEELGLTDKDIGETSLLLAGHDVLYAGVVTDQLASHKTIEGSNIIPVDYQISGGGEAFSKLQQKQVGGEKGLAERPEVEGSQFSAYGIDRVLILGVDYARKLGGKTRSVIIYPKGDSADIQAIAEEVAVTAKLPTYCGSSEGVFRMNFTALTEASGFRDLIIPLLLGGLIIFATMLGSVTDREREIYTFSSLGLAPRHVASLFFAEASVYAIIGGMGGYLLGQTVARVLGWVASLENVNISVPEINYSSTTAAVTILTVMGTVLISTIYPAVKASRSANPGIQRSWQIPKPVGDLYDLIFPFTVSAYDIMGVGSFLKEHFDNYTDTSLGIFATNNVHLFRQQDSDMIGMVADIALAPFDLGVNQRFALLSQPSEIEGINEIRILIYRLTGTNGDWQRANRVFINDLRRQLLIWRSLTTEVMDSYRSQTLEAWDSLAKEQVDESTIGDLT